MALQVDATESGKLGKIASASSQRYSGIPLLEFQHLVAEREFLLLRLLPGILHRGANARTGKVQKFPGAVLLSENRLIVVLQLKKSRVNRSNDDEIDLPPGVELGENERLGSSRSEEHTSE